MPCKGQSTRRRRRQDLHIQRAGRTKEIVDVVMTWTNPEVVRQHNAAVIGSVSL